MDDEARQYDDENEDEAVARAYQRGRRGESAAWRHDAYAHSETPDHAHTAVAMAAAAEAEAEDEADQERRDRERIERLLKDMMARQRARAQSKAPSVVSTANTSRASQQLRGGRRRRRDTGGNNNNSHNLHTQRRATTPDADIDQAGGYFDHDHVHDHELNPSYRDRRRDRRRHLDLDGDGDADSDSEAEAEREELMGLIVGSLRREVARADDEAWMFGQSSTMGAGAGAGRDEVGVYD